MNMLDTMLANVGMPPAPHNEDGYALKWVFKNDHEWSHWFKTLQEAQSHALKCGLYNHPDIVKVEIISQRTYEHMLLH